MKEKLDDRRPIYIQIKESIEDSIINGTLKVGERIPSTNELAKFYNINSATSHQGMNELAQENIIEKQRGVGMFVTERGKDKLLEHRKQLFYEKYVVPLKSEAAKLHISDEQLFDMLKKTSYKKS